MPSPAQSMFIPAGGYSTGFTAVRRIAHAFYAKTTAYGRLSFQSFSTLEPKVKTTTKR